MKKIHKVMVTKSLYLEQVPVTELMEELCAAINATRLYKPIIPARDLLTMWAIKADDGLRARIQYLARRKRGQWAHIIKTQFAHLFLPSVRQKKTKSKQVKGRQTSEEFTEDIDGSDTGALNRTERFNVGMKYLIDRSIASNGTSVLSLSKKRRRYIMRLLFCTYELMIGPRDSDSEDWTETHLYLQLLGQVATKVEVAVTCDTREDGMISMVSGVPRAFEAFVMMCVSFLIIF